MEQDEIYVKSFIEFLIEKDLMFWGSHNDTEAFCKIDLSYQSPCTIDNAILDFDEMSEYKIHRLIKELDFLNCKNIQIRFFYNPPVYKVKELLMEINTTCINNIEFIIPYSIEMDEYILHQVKENNRIDKVWFYGYSQNNYREIVPSKKVIYLSEIVASENCCGIVSEEYFTMTLSFYTESINYNTCLHKKISIDKRGNIRNCPSSATKYGHVAFNSIISVANLEEFQKVGLIKKEKISVCKDCEFRHICSDCRAYLDAPGDLLSKPLKCGYDPYTNKWEDWSQDVTKQNAYKFYNSQSNV